MTVSFKSILYALFFCFSFSVQSTAQCLFDGIISEAHDCDDDGNFLADIDFEAISVGSQGFTVHGNGTTFGPFSYDENFWTVGPFPGDGNHHTLTITDVEFGCAIDFILEAVDCNQNDCKIFDVIAEAHDCDDDGNFLVDVAFEYENVGNEGFSIKGNGNNYGTFDYGSGHVTLGPFPGDGSVLEFVVIDNQVDDCSNYALIDAPDCSNNNDCHISAVIAEIHDCEDDGTFFVDVIFEYENVGNEGFSIKGNGNNYGTFDYGSGHITLGPFPGDGSVLEFVVIDNQFNDCSDYAAIDSPVCDENCEITDFFGNAVECKTQNSYELTISMNVQNPPNNFVELSYGGLSLGLYHVNDFPVTIPNFYDFGEATPLVFAQIYESDCFGFMQFDAPNCDDHPNDCFVGPAFSFTSGCDGGKFDVTMFFDAENAGNDLFEVFYDGQNLGAFPLNQMPFTLQNFEPNGEPNPVLNICINDNPDCCRQLVLENPCYGTGCEIWDIVVEPSDCDSLGLFYLDVAFESNNTSILGFTVKGNGHNYGTFSYGEPFITIGPLEGNGSINELVIIDNEFPDCAADIGFEAVNCHADECEIVNMEIEIGDCHPEGWYSAWVGFEYVNPGNDFYDLYVNGEFWDFYPLNENPIFIEGIFPTGNGHDFIKICINDNPDCCKIIEYPSPDCGSDDCHIFNVHAEAHPCDDEGNFMVDFEFDYENVGNDGFSVKGNGNNYGSFDYGNTFYTIGPLAGDGSVYEIVIIDNQIDDCHDYTTIGPIFCDDDCHIYNVKADISDCENGEFYIKIDFDYVNVGSDGFSIHGNGDHYGFFDYGSQPIQLGPFVGDGNTVLEFYVTDVANDDCFGAIELESPDCAVGDCDIVNFVVEAGDCNDDGTYPIWIDFEVISPTHDHFDLIYNGEIIGFYSLDELPIHIPNFEGIGQTIEVMTVCINDNPDCCEEVGFQAPECGGGHDCHIWDVWTEFIECDTLGQYYIKLGFEYDGVGVAGFSVFGNGNNYGEFEYAALPITLGPFESGDDNVFELVILDNQKPACKAETEFGPYFCDDDCHINNVHAFVTDCNDEGEFFVGLNVIHQNTGNEGFTVQGNGNHYGDFSYDDLPITLGPFLGDGVTHYEFVVIDLEIDGCENWTAIEPVECPGAGCEILSLIADPGHCNSDGTYSLWINFEVENPTNDLFNVYKGDDLLGTFELADLPVEIDSYPASGHEYDVVTVCINDNPECCKTIEFMALDCGLVWPGDGNDDNIANHFDLLNIGLAFGFEGDDRPTQGIEWLGLVSEDWDNFFENMANYKHADCDGNGVVNLSDIEAIHINYDETHGEVEPYEEPPANETHSTLTVDLPEPENIILGVPFEAPIVLGTLDKPLDDIYGIAFTLNFDPDIIDPSSVEIAYDPSWIGVQPVNLITIDKTKADDGKVEVALSRTDQNNVSGFGQISAFIGIIDHIAGKQEMSIEITNIKAIDKDEMLIPLRSPTEVIELVVGTDNPDKNLRLEIFPNPTTDMIYIKNSMNYELESLEIQDVNGRILKSFEQPANMIPMSDLAAGMYIINVKIDGGEFYERIIKLEKH